MILEYINSLLGPAPNQNIEYLYYVLAIFLVIFTYKLLLSIFRKMFNIKKF